MRTTSSHSARPLYKSTRPRNFSDKHFRTTLDSPLFQKAHAPASPAVSLLNIDAAPSFLLPAFTPAPNPSWHGLSQPCHRFQQVPGFTCCPDKQPEWGSGESDTEHPPFCVLATHPVSLGMKTEWIEPRGCCVTRFHWLLPACPSLFPDTWPPGHPSKERSSFPPWGRHVFC